MDRRAIRPLCPHARARSWPGNPDHRSDRGAAEHDGDGPRGPAAERHHARQRRSDRRCHRLLPSARCGKGSLRGQQSAACNLEPRNDQHSHRNGLDDPRRTAVRARSHQHSAADRRRCCDHPLGNQGAARRNQGHRTAAGTGYGDGAANEGRTREARQCAGGGRFQAGGRTKGRGRKGGGHPRRRGPARSRVPRGRSARKAGRGRGQGDHLCLRRDRPRQYSGDQLLRGNTLH